MSFTPADPAYRTDDADELREMIAKAFLAGYERAKEDAAHEVHGWTDHNNAALRIGEMSRAEWRTAKAIITSIEHNIRALTPAPGVES